MEVGGEGGDPLMLDKASPKHFNKSLTRYVNFMRIARNIAYLLWFITLIIHVQKL